MDWDNSMPGRPWRAVALCGVLAAAGCAPELSPSTAERVSVESEDGRPLDAASRSVRLVVRGVEPALAVEGLALFEGEVSSYANNRLRRGEVVAALETRQLDVSAWTNQGAVIASAAQLLRGGVTYSLAVLGRGVLATFVVAEEEPPVLRRLWPPHVHPSGELVYCLADDAASLTDEETAAFGDLARLPPHGTEVDVRRGVGPGQLAGGQCVTFAPRDPFPGAFVLPPAMLGGALVEPEPLPVVAAAEGELEVPVAEPDCAEGELALPEICGRFEGAELALALNNPSAWFVRAEPQSEGEAREWFFTLQNPSVITLQPFEPWTEYTLFLERIDAWGRRHMALAHGETGEPRPRLVINEVLSNPGGPEPQSEWVELVNVGAATASLAGWVLEDGGGPTPLPAVEIPAGRYALIVAHDYSAAGGGDVVPAPDALPVVVDRVGIRGLANGGEPLRLVDPTGRVVSAVPAIAATKAGYSIARVDPWAPDEQGSFGRHAPPGASPGSANLLGE